MGDWIGLVVALVVGLPLLGAAVWLDVRRRRRLEGPTTGQEGYVTASEVDAMPAPPAESPREQEGATVVPFGLADPGFASADGSAELVDARVLVVEGRGATMRELMIPIARHKPLVVVAKDLDREVIDTLVANRKALRLPVLAVLTPDIEEIAELTGAEPLDVTDLKAGHVPEAALGRVTRWVSDATRSHVLT
ncbi:hypothetical protein EII34_03730 [Arachnia propionica]|uniref:Uncharacterized protein n=1 Tax=Arachnia propionica TaxID=1750 RepID=A0A3P1TCL9_9ACTN|nr:hypothetical protein [Arachnia propionica]MDO5083658.1 hypothetical protein [Arachnia propionica]RRD06243.1 hypothetical protein EII34_03730 [Arachnia propionica]